MERLTERFSNGQAAVYGCGNNCKYDFEYCHNAYEDCPTINAIYEKLAKYEDLQEQGRLLELPCSVGDNLYCDGKYFASHCAGKIHNFCVDEIITEVRSRFRGEIDYCFDFDDFGKTVFLTREEAEKALEGKSE